MLFWYELRAQGGGGFALANAERRDAGEMITQLDAASQELAARSTTRRMLEQIRVPHGGLFRHDDIDARA